MRPLLRLIVATLSVCLAGVAAAQKVSKLTLSVESVAGGTTATCTVEISAKAGPTGVIVNLTSSNPAATVPATVTVPSGQVSVGFVVTTTPVGAKTQAVIKAASGAGSASSNLLVLPPTIGGISFSPTSVTGGATATGTIKLNSAAPTGGVKVSLSSSAAAWGGPSFVMVTAGATATQFTFTTVPVLDHTDADVTASLFADKVGATLGIEAPYVEAFSVAQTTVVGGTSIVGTVTLNGPAAKQGFKVSVTSDSPLAAVPQAITVAAGKTTVQFTIATKAGKAGIARINASAPGGSVQLLLTLKASAR